jgi:hypothetical protein
MSHFKLYAYTSDSPDENILELSSVSICFNEISDLREFAAFVLSCIDRLNIGDRQAHEHFFDEGSEVNVVLALLDEKNT